MVVWRKNEYPGKFAVAVDFFKTFFLDKVEQKVANFQSKVEHNVGYKILLDFFSQ